MGCGNSLLTEELYDEGYEKIVNIDNSSTVIDQMRERNSGLRPAMKWTVMDATKMTFGDSEFDCAIDKSLMDTLMCQDDGANVCYRFFKEVERVLAEDGVLNCDPRVYFCVSFSPPKAREGCFDFLSSLGFEIQIFELPLENSLNLFTSESDFVYVCKKCGLDAKLDLMSLD
eukprot:gnl/MRDRNA2_/MRDRNA2_67539_c0_seq2.p1 gnl/MRDRNA2_/MRDRNA2_67539_c0~~gnl/MRDRNA2_/MRDRNA2_67539_c0_seq2.p1  ORF type:complete len:172 (-),score=32.99 gnl/MRDRNA2_/MRDRNA2_67539_c0_seq2:61-576(-)